MTRASFVSTLVLIFELTLIIGSLAQSTFEPSAVPLAVRSPYLSSWLKTGQSDQTPNGWPTLWTMNRTLGLAGLVRVDGQPYIWMGDVGSSTTKVQAATQRNVQITPTRTIFILEAGQLQLNVTFLSPIEPDDLALQSFPFSYIYLDARTLDGQSHSVQVHCDVSGEWLSSDDSKFIQWDTSEDDQITLHTATQQPGQTPHRDGHINMAEDATLYLAGLSGSGITWQTGNDSVVRNQFLINGTLLNTKDTNFRAIGDHWPTFGLSYDLGNVTSNSAAVAWALGLVRDPSINWNTLSNTKNYRPYFLSKYSSVENALSAFLSDFSNAKQRSIDLDSRILSAAGNVSANYADLVSLASRQTFGGIETAYAGDSIGMFMKDIGNSQRIDPVEAIYASFPAFLYINATWAKYLLEPLLQYSESSSNLVGYATPDLGNIYPNAGNVQVNASRQIEDSGSMLIMAWAHAKFTGDKSLLSTYYDTLKQWTETLIPRTLTPDGYVSIDGQDTANLTNLALKGIPGVRAMAEISHSLGEDGDARRYLDTARSYAQQWNNLAWSSDHFSSSYGRNETWTMVYNLYADRLLGTDITSQDIYDAQGRYYTHTTLSGGKYGLPFDSSSSTAISHWTLFMAGALANSPAQNNLIQMVHDKTSDRSNSAIFPTTYNVNDGHGSIISGTASPAQGAMFALLALDLETKLTGISTTSPLPSSSAGSKTGAIVGGVVGGAFVLIAGLALGWYLRRRQRKKPHLTPFTEGLYTNVNSTQPRPLPSAAHFSNTDKEGGGSPQLNAINLSNIRLYSGNGSKSSSASASSPLYHSRTNYDQPRQNIERGAETHRLQADVQNLRRELEDLRTRGFYEPPPSYD